MFLQHHEEVLQNRNQPSKLRLDRKNESMAKYVQQLQPKKKNNNNK